MNQEDGNELQWQIPRTYYIGFCLAITLPHDKNTQGSTVKIRVYYNTTTESGGIQWFEPQQTMGKKYPFVYTQFEAILARTALPCQDTPSVKAPYSIKITVPSPLVVACSGNAVGSNPTQNGDLLTYHYDQPMPIPAYLIAIVAGALEKGQVGPRSSVWTEKELLDACVHEFSDTEQFIVAGEKITGVPYEWGTYDMVVLPGAFPYGGMENPQLTFLSRSLIAGDKSLVNVVAHEIAHSWSGNLVTNKNWSDFWLNEGFTVYLERLILGEVRKSEQYRDFESLCGYNDLKKTIADENPDFTKLRPDIRGIDPDEVFSKIPYEKGSLFLRFLETKVGGKEMMCKWLNNYFTTFRQKSVAVIEMKDHFINFFKSNNLVSESVLDSIDWDTWLNGSGFPPFDPNTLLDTSLTLQCYDLANIWKEKDGEGAKESDLHIPAKQTMFFLDILLTTATPMKHETLNRLDSIYSLSKSKNVEILFRWIMLNLKSKQTQIFPTASEFLSHHGRGLYVKPLYKTLHEVDLTTAREIYLQNKHFYHSVIRNAFDPLFVNKQ